MGNNLLTRELALDTKDFSFDVEARSLSNVPFTSGTPVERYAFWGVPGVNEEEDIGYKFLETLSQDVKNWHLERVKKKSCHLLDNHNPNSRLGLILKVEFDGDRGYFNAKLSRCESGDQLLRDLEDGIAGGVSFAYKVNKYRVVKPAVWEGKGWERKLKKMAELEAIDITLYEVSRASIPADSTVGFKHSENAFTGDERVNLKSVQIDGCPNFIEDTEEKAEEQNMPPETETESKAESTANQAELLELRNSNKELNARLTQLETDNAAFKQQLEVREQELQAAQNRQNVTEEYTSLRSQAEDLLQAAKMTAAEFNDTFGERTKDIEKLIADGTELISIKFWLGKVEKRTAVLNTVQQTNESQREALIPATTTDSSDYNADSIADDAKIRQRCQELGIDPGDINNYKRAKKELGIKY